MLKKTNSTEEENSINHYRYVRSYGVFSNEKDKIELEISKEIRKTKCGYWIHLYGDKEKFILKNSKKKYAYPTKELALNSFKIRTKRSLDYAVSNKKKALSFIKLIKEFNIE